MAPRVCWKGYLRVSLMREKDMLTSRPTQQCIYLPQL